MSVLGYGAFLSVVGLRVHRVEGKGPPVDDVFPHAAFWMYERGNVQ